MQDVNGFTKSRTQKKIEYSLFVWAIFIVFSVCIFFYFKEFFWLVFVADILFTLIILMTITNSKQ